MNKSINIIKALHLKATPVPHSIMPAVARGVVMAHDRNLLVENGGHRFGTEIFGIQFMVY